MNLSMRPADTGSFVPLRSTTVKTSVPSTATNVFSIREKPGESERVTAWVSWNAWYLPTFVLDMDSTVVSILPLPGTELAGTDSVKSLHFAYLALASADGASRKLAVARAADTANLVRSDIGA